MCGRFFLITSPEALGALFGVDCRGNFPARYNIAPTQPVGVVRQGREEREFVLMRWGLYPAWMKTPPTKPLINARSETVLEKASFKNAFRRRRCLIPTDGFYEWMAEDGRKQPWCIRRKDKALFAFAAIWETWMGADGSEMDTVAILTTGATDDLAHIHHRMPVLIAPEDFNAWLDHEGEAVDTALRLLKPPPVGTLEAYRVGEAVNKATNEGPDLMKEAAATPKTPPPPSPQGAFDF